MTTKKPEKSLLRKLIPQFVKLWYLHFKSISRNRSTRRKQLNEIHQYWQNPDEENKAELYLSEEDKLTSRYLVNLLKSRGISKESRILEIGCNVGRNLNFLYKEGYKNIEGIEISSRAVELMREHYPEMAAEIKIFNHPIEEVIKDFGDGNYDLVFTVAVLEHIHYESEWVFNEIVRITSTNIITIEDELGVGDRHFTRNYNKVFIPMGLKQVYSENLDREEHGRCLGTVTRVFEKTQ